MKILILAAAAVGTLALNDTFKSSTCSFNNNTLTCVNGLCNNEDGLSCDCGAGYFGDFCENSRCLNNACNGGTCINRDMYPYYIECNCTNIGKTGPYCEEDDVCGDGYYGKKCDISRCHEANPCMNGGLCGNQEDYPFELKCDCTGTGYAGDKCQTKCVHGLYNMSSGKCDCNSDKYGESCNSLCVATEDDVPGKCSNGICRDRCYIYDYLDCSYDLICDCEQSYFGQYCDLEDQCTEFTCKNGGQCNQLDFLYNACDCEDTGYHGLYCTEPDCPPDFCNDGVCYSEKPKKPECDCGSGYKGKNCETSICETDTPCHNGGKCTNADLYPFDAVCDCSGTGFNGQDCQNNDCDNCPGNSTCSINPAKPGQPTCTCLVGYEGPSCDWKCFDYCRNDGTCEIVQKEARCECSGTGHHGLKCEIMDCGFNNMCKNGICDDNNTCVCFDGFKEMVHLRL